MMPSYKKAAAEAETRLAEALNTIALYESRIKELEEGLIASAEDVLTNEDAKAVLRAFSSRAKNREEVLLLIRTLTRL